MADIRTELTELTRMKYVDQAKWFLNGFWKEGAEAESESIWKFTHKFIELDTRKKTDGCELDEFEAHKFLESLGETLTVIALREKLRKIDVDANGKMALLEYLMFKYGKSMEAVVNAPQGGNQEELMEAQRKLQAVQDALVQVQRQLEQQQAAEEAVRRSEAEQRAAVEEVRRQEEAYHNTISSLERKRDDPNAGQVAKSKAAAELAQVKQEDPLPLRKAKITQEAALRKVEKERKAAEAATAALEQTVRETEAKFREAQEYLEQAKRKGGVSYGAIWWMERELKEAQKYMPKKKQTM